MTVIILCWVVIKLIVVLYCCKLIIVIKLTMIKCSKQYTTLDLTIKIGSFKLDHDKKDKSRLNKHHGV